MNARGANARYDGGRSAPSRQISADKKGELCCFGGERLSRRASTHRKWQQLHGPIHGEGLEERRIDDCRSDQQGHAGQEIEDDHGMKILVISSVGFIG